MLPILLHVILLCTPTNHYVGVKRRNLARPPIPKPTRTYERPRPTVVPASEHWSFRRSLPIPDFRDVRHRLPSDPRLWSNWHVYYFLESEMRLPKLADACALRVSKWSFQEVDGPQLLRLGLYGLRRELKLDKEVSDSRMASAQAKWEAWPWPPNLYNDTNSEMEQRASGHGGFDGTAPREVVTSLIENPSTPPASRESATAEAASTVLPPRSLLDRYIVVPQGEYGGAEHRYDRIRAALWGIFIADSLGMPAHWYYNPEQLRRDVGTIVGYRAAPRRHSGNTLMQSQWQGNKHGVRDLVDKFMLFGKASAWKTPYQHFHAGMQAGENTLNARCALLLVQSIASNNGQYDRDAYLQKYVEFHRTPGSHNDSYAEGHHRQFLQNFATGRCSNHSLHECAGEQNHDTSSIGAFVGLPVVAFAAAAVPGSTLSKVARVGRDHVRATHRSLLLELSAEL